MKKILLFSILAFLFISTQAFTNESDSAYLFAYTKMQNEGRSGLFFAWSTDKENWHAIGPEFGFVKSDYSRWGSEKRMIKPFIFYGADSLWHCLWNLNNTDEAIAYTTSKDLQSWIPQSYFVRENDLTIFSLEKINSERSRRQQVSIQGKSESGTINKVPWSIVTGLIKKVQVTEYRNQLWSETTKEDALRFGNLKAVDVSIIPDVSKPKKISDMLVGAFFEDINYAADGGLYAELVQNRDFEYDPADKEGRDRNWNSKTAWSTTGDVVFNIESESPVHLNNKNYAVLKVGNGAATFINNGFDGIAIKAGERYNFSLFAKSVSGNNRKLIVRLVDKEGGILAESSANILTKSWKKKNIVLLANKTVADASLQILLPRNEVIALDMISLFPQKTFKNRKNGLRADLAQSIADLHPKFVRFPGGCVAHGDGIENIYNWKSTVGPLEARKPQRNLWGYHQTAGLGYYEYFQFCEDIGAEPVPVVAAGVPCQNSAKHGHPLGGQQCGIPMSEMGDYVQDVLDLIEWANGGANTKWGKVRAASGHPQPFNLKYIGIGNEYLISNVFEERFTMIYKAVKEKYPDITIIGTVGPFFEGSDYEEGWKLATKLNVPIVDEHYYISPGWFIYNQNFYDKYDRSKSKVYLGEYAAHLPGRPNNLETALAEAIHLTALERNGDVVHMASYAPLLAKEGHTQWNPDMIYFNNTTIKPTTGYYVQQMFGQNAGDEYISCKTVFSDNNEKVKNRIAWSVVKNTKTNDLVIKMVNLLPVNANVSIDLSAFQLNDTLVTKTVLSGQPAERNLTPVQTEALLKEIEKMNLQPYSFTVIRLKLK
jgi:alpha-L-arabinofuranosidase